MSHQTQQPPTRSIGSQARGPGPFTDKFVPGVRPGDFVELQTTGQIREVQAVTPLPVLPITLSRTSNGTNEDQSLDDLKMPESWLAQYRILDAGDLPTGTNLFIDQGGQQSPIYLSKNQRGFIDENSPTDTEDANLTELWQFSDRDLFASVEDTNGDGSDFTVQFSGFGYLLSESPVQNAPPERIIPIPVEQIQSGIP